MEGVNFRKLCRFATNELIHRLTLSKTKPQEFNLCTIMSLPNLISAFTKHVVPLRYLTARVLEQHDQTDIGPGGTDVSDDVQGPSIDGGSLLIA